MVEPVVFAAGDVITNRWGSKTVTSITDYLVRYTDGTADPQHVLSGLIGMGLASRKEA